MGEALFTSLYPKGWICSDLAFLSNVHQQRIDSLENREGPLRPADFDSFESEMDDGSFLKVKHLLSSLALPAKLGIVSKGTALRTRKPGKRLPGNAIGSNTGICRIPWPPSRRNFWNLSRTMS